MLVLEKSMPLHKLRLRRLVLVLGNSAPFVAPECDFTDVEIDVKLLALLEIGWWQIN